MWVKMMPRLISDMPALVRILKVCRKFNETLDELLYQESHMYMMNLISVIEANYFDQQGNLTKSGRIQFWAEVNHQMHLFDVHDKDFVAIKLKSSRPQPLHDYRHGHNDQYHWNCHGHNHHFQSESSRKLPNPPPKY